MTRHYVQVSGRVVEVDVLEAVFGGVQVEVVRKYPSIGLCKGQLLTLPHDMISSKSERRLKREARAKAHNAAMRRKDRQAKKASESASKAPKSQSGSGDQACPVCGSRHASGACKMVSADMTSK